MIKTVLKIEGMACGMCESHVNDTIRREFPIDRVRSSHARGETVILSEDELNADALRASVGATGYRVIEVTSAPYERRGLFSFLRKK